MNRLMNNMQKFAALALLVCAALPLSAANTVVTVAQVTSGVTVSTDEDYTVTSATPFTTAGSVNLTSENSVLILKSVIPSKTLSTYLGNVYIYGSKAVNGSNCTVSIYNTGTIILPYSPTSKGLTVYTEKNFGGKTNTYTPGSLVSLTGDFNTSIKSFKLKRGYMAMLGVSTSFNKVWVASDGDLEITELPKAFSGKITILRVLRWQWPSKKGYAGTDMTANPLLNTTSFYGWNASDYSRTDREYVPHHHHEGWPGISDVTGHSDGTAILGNNEPDNTSGSEVQSTVAQVLANWPQMMAGGQRLGSPAVAGNLGGWLYPFIDSIDAKGYRCDFVAVHAYWNSQPSAFMNSLKSIYNRTKRPLWITEFNYGANWTTETWPTADRSGTADNYERERAWMAQLIPLLDAAPYVERYFIYNWVQDCRKVYNTGDASLESTGYLTPAGLAYANTSTSQLAYTGAYDLTPNFKYQPPYALDYTYGSTTQSVTLTWVNYNGVQTDSTFVERSYNNGAFIPIDTIYSTNISSQSFKDALKTQPTGSYIYRIHNYDSDGAQRYSSTVAVTKGGAEGKPGFQYGSLTLYNTEMTVVDFDTLAGKEVPAVFISPCTHNNLDVAPVEHLASIISNQFKFQYLPWSLSTYQTLAKPETTNFLVVKKGDFTYGDMKMEVATIGTLVKNDTTQVTFTEPFPEGVKPIVLATIQTMSNLYPYTVKIWDVNNTGFKVKLAREAGLTTKYPNFPGQRVHYMAVSPGTAKMDNGRTITAGYGATAIGGSIRRSVKLLTEDGTPYTFSDTPLLFMQSQTCNYDAASILRCSAPALSTDGTTWSAYVYRQVDPSSGLSNGSTSYDDVAWVALSTDTTYVDGIRTITAAAPLKVSVSGRRIYVADGQPFKLYSLSGAQIAADSQLTPGVYIVRSGSRTTKVLVTEK
jgi:hypothetical protein